MLTVAPPTRSSAARPSASMAENMDAQTVRNEKDGRLSFAVNIPGVLEKILIGKRSGFSRSNDQRLAGRPHPGRSELTADRRGCSGTIHDRPGSPPGSLGRELL